jgi:Zn-dependent protease with chaperone function
MKFIRFWTKPVSVLFVIPLATLVLMIVFRVTTGGLAPAAEKRFQTLAAQLETLSWSLSIGLILVGVVYLVVCSVLARTARQSRSSLIRSYRVGWELTRFITLLYLVAQGFLVVSLCFILPILFSGRTIPQLVGPIFLAWAWSVFRVTPILVRRFQDQPSERKNVRLITPAENPPLWENVTALARKMQVDPPDQIVADGHLNFMVTETPFKIGDTVHSGRSLFVSWPLLNRLDLDQTRAIIAHELAHFHGADTQLTQHFYPALHRSEVTQSVLHASGWVGHPSLGSRLTNLGFSPTPDFVANSLAQDPQTKLAAVAQIDREFEESENTALLHARRQIEVQNADASSIESLFPPVVYPYSSTLVTACALLFFLLGVACAVGFSLMETKADWTSRLPFILLTTAAFVGVGLWILSYRRASLSLNLTGLHLSSWPRAVNFEQVSSVAWNLKWNNKTLFLTLKDPSAHPLAGTFKGFFTDKKIVQIDVYSYLAPGARIVSDVVRYYRRDLPMEE